jgi:hypothetical protein
LSGSGILRRVAEQDAILTVKRFLKLQFAARLS